MAGPTSSARFGGVGIGDPRLTFRLDTKQYVHLVDRISQKFLGGQFQGALAIANEKMAKAIQESIAEALDEQIDKHRHRNRPRRPGERLRHAIMHHDNIDVTASSFRVGIPAWYDRSPAALYWRAVEHGRGPYEVSALFTDAPEGGPVPAGGFVRPQEAPVGNMRMLILRNARRAPTFMVAGNPAYEFHEAGVLRALQHIKPGQVYLLELARVGLPMQLRSGATAKGLR